MFAPANVASTGVGASTSIISPELNTTPEENVNVGVVAPAAKLILPTVVGVPPTTRTIGIDTEPVGAAVQKPIE